MLSNSDTVWTPDHFIGGHPAIDLTNAVFTRQMPDDDNDLLNTSRDIGNWLHFAGLATKAQAKAVSGMSAPAFVASVRELREESFSVFDALAAGKPPAAKEMGALFERAAKGLSAGRLKFAESDAVPQIANFDDPEAIVALLAFSSVEAYFVLQRERLHACPRCGWLFMDTSRGGKRRWCSMQTCGNREKSSRHRVRADRK
jgi:predicted RNA-binding Zn ribbon-like protein